MIEKATDGKESFKGKRVAISGSGNVAQYAALKVIELGGIVVSLSDSKGSIISKNGITVEQVRHCRCQIEIQIFGRNHQRIRSIVLR